MKKRIACLLTALLVLSCATPVLAAPSNEATEPEVKVETSVEGVELEVVVADEDVVYEAEEVAEEVAAELAEELSTDDEEAEVTATVLTVVEINLVEGDIPEDGLQLTIKADGVEAGDDIVLLHQKADGEWETIIPDEVRDGEIVATFTSLSPVAIVKVESSVDTDVEDDEDIEDDEDAEDVEDDADVEDDKEADDKDADKDDAPTAPKAGASLVLPLAALVCAAGATVCKRKVN